MLNFQHFECRTGLRPFENQLCNRRIHIILPWIRIPRIPPTNRPIVSISGFQNHVYRFYTFAAIVRKFQGYGPFLFSWNFLEEDGVTKHFHRRPPSWKWFLSRMKMEKGETTAKAESRKLAQNCLHFRVPRVW